MACGQANSLQAMHVLKLTRIGCLEPENLVHSTGVFPAEKSTRSQ
jgi:hypothetical protein